MRRSVFKCPFVGMHLFVLVVALMVGVLQSVGVGVDTIKASIPVWALAPEAFDNHHEVRDQHGEVSLRKWTINRSDEPRLTYYASNGRALVEVSLPKYYSGQNTIPLSHEESLLAVAKVDAWLADIGEFPPLKLWAVRRADYFTGWRVGEEAMPVYLDAIKRLEMVRYERHVFRTGVSWRTKSRVMQLYDKYAESGQEVSRGVLRFEVSNKQDAITYMQQAWFPFLSCTVEAFLSPKVHQQVVSHFLTRLGIDRLQLEAVDMVDLVLRREFGRSWAQAKTYLQLIDQYQSDVWRRGYMSRASFYRYKGKLELIASQPQFLPPMLEV